MAELSLMSSLFDKHVLTFGPALDEFTFHFTLASCSPALESMSTAGNSDCWTRCFTIILWLNIALWYGDTGGDDVILSGEDVGSGLYGVLRSTVREVSWNSSMLKRRPKIFSCLFARVGGS